MRRAAISSKGQTGYVGKSMKNARYIMEGTVFESQYEQADTDSRCEIHGCGRAVSQPVLLLFHVIIFIESPCTHTYKTTPSWGDAPLLMSPAWGPVLPREKN